MKNSQIMPLDDIQVISLLADIYNAYGYDFRNYASASLKRRLRHFMIINNIPTISSLRSQIFHDYNSFNNLLMTLSVLVTSMFRDPNFYLTLRHKVIPMLRTYPFVRIWIAGCSTGEEAYSIAILLLEEELYKRSIIYATDMNIKIVEMAKDGIFPLSSMKNYEKNYILAGGKRELFEYYTPVEERAIIHSEIKKNIYFARHNLVTDSGFNEFNLILCRNVMIYFNQSLQEQTHRLLFKSLAPFCFLALGNKESILFSPHEENYITVDDREKIYKKGL